MLRDSVTIDDLVAAYLRFKEWMDYDLERSAYCAKEIMVLQELFGVSYVVVPPALRNSSHSELLQAMAERMALLDELLDAIYYPADDGKYERVLGAMDKTTFRSTVHYFTTLHEAIFQAADSIVFEDPDDPERYPIDSEPFDDHYDTSDALVEGVRDFIISEHPRLESVSFSLEKVYALGLPRIVPPPIDHGPPSLDS